MVELSEYISKKGFVHPGIGGTAETLKVMREKVKAGVSPWVDYFEGLRRTKYGMPDTKPVLVEKITNDNEIRDFNIDAQIALGNAIVYIVTGCERYRVLPVKIIGHYGEYRGEFFPRGFTDSHIKLGRPVFTMCIAAELMRYIKPNDTTLTVTDEMIKNLCENSLRQIVKRNLRYNNYFMNQHSYAVMGYLAYTILAEDTEGYREAVEWTLVNSTCKDPLGYSGSVKHQMRMVERNDKTGDAVEPNLQLVEMGRDQPHAGGNVDNLLKMCRAIEYQKTKVDGETGTVTESPHGISPVRFLDDRIIKSAALFAKYNMGYGLDWVPTYANCNDTYTVTYDNISPTWRGRLVTNGIPATYYYYKGLGVDFTGEYRYIKAALDARCAMQEKRARSGEFIETLHNYTFDFWIGLSEGASDAKPNKEKARRALAEDMPPLKIIRNGKALEENAIAYNFVDLEALEGGENPIEVINEADTTFVRIKVDDKPKSMVVFSSLRKNTKIKVRSDNTVKLKIHKNEDYTKGKSDIIYMPDTKGEWCYVLCNANIDDIAYFEIEPIEGKANVDFEKTEQGDDAISFSTNAADYVPAFVGNRVVKRYKIEDSPCLYSGINLPDGAAVDSMTGTLTWTPKNTGSYRTYIRAQKGSVTSVQPVTIKVCENLDEAIDYCDSFYDENVKYESASLNAYKSAKREGNLRKIESAVKGLKALTPRLPDGSLDYCSVCTSDNPSIVNMIDDDVYTFGGLWGEDKHFTMDFGERYKVRADSFGMQARDGFPIRVKAAVVYGSDDKKVWYQLTRERAKESVEMQILEVKAEEKKNAYRYIRFFMPKTYYHIFELSELRIWGERIEGYTPDCEDSEECVYIA